MITVQAGIAASRKKRTGNRKMRLTGNMIAMATGAALAGALAAWLLLTHADVPLIPAAITGGIVFSVLISFATIIRIEQLTRKLRRLEAGIRSHEGRLSSRIDTVENSIPALSRIERLERKLAGRVHSDIAASNRDNIHARTTLFPEDRSAADKPVAEDAGISETGNVVLLHPSPAKKAEQTPARDKSGSRSRAEFDTDEIQIRLQPAVSLDNRKVFAFEASACVEDFVGQLHDHATVLSALESDKELRRFDKCLADRALSLVRSLRRQGKSPLVFVPVSGTTFKSGSAFDAFDEMLEAQRKLGKNIVWEISQAEHAGFSKTQRTRLRQILERGFALCLSGCQDQEGAGETLAQGLFTYAKMPVSELESLDAISLNGPQSELMIACEETGATLIVTGVEHERQAVHLIDHQVRFAQGSFFSPPKFPATSRQGSKKASKK